MKKQLIATVLGCTVAAFSLPASAQFGKLGAALGGSGSNSSVSADSLVKSYVNGTQFVMSSNVSFLKALNMKEQAEKVEVAAKNLTQGPTTANLEEAAKVQTESSKAIADTMAANTVTLSADSKKDYVRGVVELAKGIKTYTGMAGDVKNFKPGMSSIGAGAGAALYVVKTAPGTLTDLKDSLARSIAFAKQNKIELPADATAVL
jgi:hypothetical protein